MGKKGKIIMVGHFKDIKLHIYKLLFVLRVKDASVLFLRSEITLYSVYIGSAQHTLS